MPLVLPFSVLSVDIPVSTYTRLGASFPSLLKTHVITISIVHFHLHPLHYCVIVYFIKQETLFPYRALTLF